MDLPDIPTRIALAPMAGGVCTPELVAAVADAGGLGFLATGYLSGDRVREDLAAVRALTDRPFAVNLFVPGAPSDRRRARAEAYAARLGAWLGDAGLLEPPRFSDDAYDDKVAVALKARPALVSFAFGLPSVEVVEAFRDADVPVAVTVTTPAEARAAVDAGADVLVVQGWEAGAHRGTFDDEDTDEQPGLLTLLRLVAHETGGTPMIAAGGIADGAGVAAVLAAGAEAAMLGTAFLRCPEAGTSPVHRAAVAAPGGTTVTRAFTGRRARGIDNAMLRAMHDHAPSAYPEVHFVTTRLRSEARSSADPEHLHLWAGQAHTLARELPAGDLTRTLAREAAQAAARAARLLGS
ncbi:MAG: NAD(P)H-dependent flavin oxidoreductase [Nocardioidaceae bacterium]